MTMRNFKWLLSLYIMGTLCFSSLVSASEAIKVDVILVRASDGQSVIDGNLKPYVGTLQRLFRFDRYETLSRKSVSLSSSERLNLGSGQSVALTLGESTASSARVEVEWNRGSTRLLHTRVQLMRDLPAVLGGPRGEEGILLLLVVRKG
jgi:hypothetical protein